MLSLIVLGSLFGISKLPFRVWQNERLGNGPLDVLTSDDQYTEALGLLDIGHDLLTR